MLLFLNRGYKNVVEGWRYKTKMLPAQSSLYSLVVARFLLGTLVVRGPAPLSLPVPLPVLALLLWGPVLALLGGLLVPVSVPPTTTAASSLPSPVIIIISVAIILSSLSLKVRPILPGALVTVQLLAELVLAGVRVTEILIGVLVFFLLCGVIFSSSESL